MAKRKRRVKNKKKVKPISLLSKLNRLRDGSFESDKIPSIVGVLSGLPRIGATTGMLL